MLTVDLAYIFHSQFTLGFMNQKNSAVTSATHLDGSPGFLDHELQPSKHRLRGVTGVHVRVAVVRIVERNDHRLVSGQLEGQKGRQRRVRIGTEPQYQTRLGFTQNSDEGATWFLQ